MINTIGTFFITVLTYYTFANYRYFAEHIETIKEFSWMHFQWHVVYLFMTLLVINYAQLVAREVNILMKLMIFL